MHYTNPPYVRPGDRVAMTIHGDISDMNEQTITITLADGLEIAVSRTAISRVQREKWQVRAGDVYVIGNEVVMIKVDDDHLLYAHSSDKGDASFEEVGYLLYPENLVYRTFKVETLG